MVPVICRLTLCTVIALAIAGCSTTRVRIPVGVVPDQGALSLEDEEYGREVLDSLTKQFQLERDDAPINRVRDIVDRLAEAAKVNFNPWHAYVFRDSNFKNAAATRGNFIFVWTGVLDSVKNDAELAGIIAHEMGHVLAGHTNPNAQEEAQEMIAGVAGSIANNVIYAQGGGWGLLAGLGEMLVRAAVEGLLTNPEQQRKELEADQIGLFLMADARYNPDELANFWERVRADPHFAGFPVQFLSSHPSSDERIAQLNTILPEALLRYEGALVMAKHGGKLPKRKK